MVSLALPAADGSIHHHTFRSPAELRTNSTAPTSRDVYAAAHVVADPLRASAENAADQIDWDATMSLRHDLWSLGLGVAESMDTAQRGMGLDWVAARELASRTLHEAATVGGRVVVGVTTDQIKTETASLEEIRDAYIEQVEAIEGVGGDTVLMASRHLARAASGPDDYWSVYNAVLSQATRPVVLHWLGSVFDPALQGYWGHPEPAASVDTVLSIIRQNTKTVRGIKVSVLDPDLERELRRRMPDGVRVYTGDDYNYVDMIAGDDLGSSDALLGAFAAIGPFASAAFARLDVNDKDGFRQILRPTEALSRLVFASPTQFYKVGVAWLAYLNGRQGHFRMVGGLESGRTVLHLADLIRAADGIGLFTDPEFTARRAAGYFAVHGLA